MDTYSPEFLNFSFEVFKDLLILGIVGILNFIFTICTMIIINQDAKKRQIKCWHWNLVIFLLSYFLLGFIPIIFYIVFACNKNPIIENNIVIDTRSNDNNGNDNNASNANYLNNANSSNKKAISYPKYLLFYAIIQFVSLCITISTLVDVIEETFDILKYAPIITNNYEIENNSITEYSLEYGDLNNFDENNFNFKNIKISDDIKDYANQVFMSASDKIINSPQAENNFAIFNTFVASLSNPTGSNIAQFFSDSLVTYEFAYSNEYQGILQISPNLSNLTINDINSLKAQSISNFSAENLNSILLISQNINGLTLNKVINIDIDDIETVNLNKYNVIKDYPVYISFYSNILSDNYEVNVTLS